MSGRAYAEKGDIAEAEDIWDEMPNFEDYGSVMWEEHGVATDRWLEKLKVEYNELKEKAMKLDEVIELLRVDSGVIMDDIHEWLIEVQAKYVQEAGG